MVSYVNYDTDVIPPWNGFYPIVHKRQAYDWEREIRGVYSANWSVTDPTDPSKGDWAPVGDAVIPISVDLDKLVEAVYVSPNARDWFAKLVRDVLSRYGKSWPIQYSSIDGEPIF
jgi:hypothetical protein